MEEKSGTVEPEASTNNSHAETPVGDLPKRPATYSYLTDPRTERPYGIDPWGNDWGE